MIYYRNYNHEKDYEKVKELCSKHSLAFPYNNKHLIVAENEQGQIVGVGGIRIDFVFNPLIAENNPLVANNIGRMIEGVAIVNGIKRLRAEVDSDNVKHIQQLEKDGYEIVENNKIILEKIFI